MADAVRDEARRLRESAREQRRGAGGALEDMGETIRSKKEDVFDEDFVDSLKALVKPAVAAAVVGGLTGLAKAMFDRRGSADDSDDEPEQADRSDADSESDHDVPHARAAQLDDDEQEADEPEGRADQLDDEEDADEPEGRADQLDDDEQDEADEDADSELQRAQLYEQAEAQEDDENDDEDDVQEPEARAERDYDSEAEDSDEDADEQETGASLSDALAPVDKAREVISRLMGSDAESVSGIARSNGNWKVSVEVVELHRIPESTDVMASYEVVLDGDCNVVSLERTRRYRRSQVEEG